MRRFALMPELAARLDGAGQIATAADHLGAMQSLLDMTLDYVKTRNQFGRPLGSFQALQHRLVDMYVALEEARGQLQGAVIEVPPQPAISRRHLSPRTRTGVRSRWWWLQSLFRPSC